MLLISSPRFQEHITPPGHPERPERAEVFDAVAPAWRDAADAWSSRGRRRARSCCASTTPAYLDAIAATAGRAAMLDPDTFTRPESLRDRAARRRRGRRGGGARVATRARPAFALVRPPGHHAERDRAMGFCLYNNIAVAAAAALRARAVARRDRRHRRAPRQRHAGDVLRRPDGPLRVDATSSRSTRAPARPTKTGTGAGEGFTFNVPLAAGATDADYAAAYRTIGGRARRVPPELMLVSAGFDAHERRSAGVDAGDDGRLRRGRASLVDAAARSRLPRSRSSPKAATTSTRSARCLEASARRSWR